MIGGDYWWSKNNGNKNSHYSPYEGGGNFAFYLCIIGGIVLVGMIILLFMS